MNVKLFFSLVLAASLSFAAEAQNREKRSPEERAKRMTTAMSERLNLSEDQKTAVYKANLEMATTARANRDEMKKAAEAHDAQMKNILSEDQYAQYQKNKEKRDKRKELHRESGKLQRK